MGGFSSITGDESIMNADNASFDGTERGGKMTTNGQLWIGSTASPHVKKGTIISPLGTLQVGYSSPNVTLDLVGGVNDLHVAKWIVNNIAGQGGNKTTIASATASASAGDTIFVMPGSTGTYTENFTLPANINLVAMQGDQSTPHVTIIGKITMTAVGTSSISNIRLQTNSDFAVVVSGNSASILNLNNCYLNCTNNTGISFTSSSGSAQINLFRCQGDLGTTGIALFSSSSSGNMSFNYNVFTNSGGSTTANTISSGFVNLGWSNFKNPITTSSTGGIGVLSSQCDTSAQNVTAITHGGSGAGALFVTSYIASGSASAISVGTGVTLPISDCTISSSNTNAITGLGTLNFSGLVFSNSSSTINTTNLSPMVVKGGFYQGNLTSTAPAAGMLGEELKSAVTGVSFTTGTNKDITSLSITPGIWDVTAQVVFISPGISIAGCTLGLSTISATFQGNFGDQQSTISENANVWAQLPLIVANFRVSISVSTTYFAVGFVLFNSGTCTASGSIKARRIA